jgi:hypothetical protein
VTINVERHHWVNTTLGMIDATWHLTDAEKVQVAAIIARVLDVLDIPGRGQPTVIPMPLMMEASAGFYSMQVNTTAQAASIRPIRAIVDGDLTFPPDVWRASITTLFTSAYPDLEPLERVFLDSTIGDLLDAIGVDTRAAQFVSEDVARVAEQRS